MLEKLLSFIKFPYFSSQNLNKLYSYKFMSHSEYGFVWDKFSQYLIQRILFGSRRTFLRLLGNVTNVRLRANHQIPLGSFQLFPIKYGGNRNPGVLSLHHTLENANDRALPRDYILRSRVITRFKILFQFLYFKYLRQF